MKIPLNQHTDSINIPENLDSNKLEISNIVLEVDSSTNTLDSSLLDTTIEKQVIDTVKFLKPVRNNSVVKIRKKIVKKFYVKEKQVNDSLIFSKAKEEGLSNIVSGREVSENCYGFLNSRNTKDIFVRNPDYYGDISIYRLENNIRNEHQYVSYLEKPSVFKRFPNNVSLKHFNDWTVGIVFFSMVLLGWGKLIFNKYFIQILTSVYNYRLSINLFKDKNILLRRINAILNTIFTINLSIFFIQLFNFYAFNPFGLSPISYFLIFLVLIPTIYFIKATVNFIIVEIFSSGPVIREYIYNVFLLNKSLGLYLFPIIIIIPFISSFSTYFIFMGLGVIAYIYILRIIRVVQIIFYKDVSFLYLFLYLCTLEILPIVMIIKIIALYN